jgi:hypothetical protein
MEQFKSFLDIITGPTILVIAALEVVLFVLLLRRFIKTKSLISLFAGLIAIGLAYDALIIGLGMWVNANNMLFLSRLRFVSHGLLTPLLFAISARSYKLSKPLVITLFSIMGALMLFGIIEGSLNVLTESTTANISRLAIDKEATPKILYKGSTMVNIISIIPVIVIGIIAWVKQKNCHLALAGIFMFVFSAIGPAIGLTEYIFFISMIGEILMIGFILLYDIKKDKLEATNN